MRRGPLSERELQAIRLIRNAIVHRGRAPTVRELAAGLNYRSPRSASDILDSLQARGIVKRGADRKLRLTRDPEEDNFRARTVDVPLVGTVAGGAPILASENIQAMVPVSISLACPPHRYFLLRIAGDSMNRAGINDGDLVLVRQQSTADNGDRVVALIDDEATVKVLQRSRDAVLLVPRSTNPKHMPIVLTHHFQVQGVVRAAIPNLKENLAMPKKNVIVGPAGPGKWTVRESGRKEPVSTHRTQGAAIDKAKPLARKNESELIIQGRDGEFRSKDSYGKDPNPPKDKEH